MSQVDYCAIKNTDGTTTVNAYSFGPNGLPVVHASCTHKNPHKAHDMAKAALAAAQDAPESPQ